MSLFINTEKPLKTESERQIMIQPINWKKIGRVALLVITDLFSVSVMSLITLMLLYDMKLTSIPAEYLHTLEDSLFFIFVFYVSAFFVFKLYGSMWEFAGVNELIRIILASISAAIVTYIFFRLLSRELPVSFFFLDWLLIMIVSGGLRLGNRILSMLQLAVSKTTKICGRVMLVGAGKMGTLMLEELENEQYKYGKAVVFVDDDSAKQRKNIRGVRIAGKSGDIPRLVKKYHVDSIIFCIPSASVDQRKRILDIALTTGCCVKVAQSIHGSLKNDGATNCIRNVDVADLLSRPEVKLDTNLCGYITDQTVLVTGGGGSIGSELCRQVAKYHPKEIIIFDVSENSAVEIYNELLNTYGQDIDLKLRIGSVRDIKRLEQVFREFQPSIVFHAAAHKHVPIMEESPCEAVKNNVFGTLYTAKVASRFNVSRFVLLSTDKAVNPTSVMGATKRITEMVIQAVNWHNQTVFTAVRFGNVLGSSGSVIPIFKKQIEKGGPITVTHPEVTRFFMTIPEAAQLVVQAGGMARGGDVFVLDMGEPVKILDLAYNLIRLSGLEPDRDIKIEFTGLRPGEKLFEELSYEEEEQNRQTTQNSKIFRTPPIEFDTKAFRVQLDELQKYAENGDDDAAKRAINDIIYGCINHKSEGSKQLA